MKVFSPSISSTANRPPRSAGLCRKREAVRNRIRPPRPLRLPLVKGKRSLSRSRCGGICLRLRSCCSAPPYSTEPTPGRASALPGFKKNISDSCHILLFFWFSFELVYWLLSGEKSRLKQLILTLEMSSISPR